MISRLAAESRTNPATQHAGSGEDYRLLPAREVGVECDGNAADADRNDRRRHALLPQRLVQLDCGEHQRDSDQYHKGRLEVDQTKHDVRAESDADAYGGRQIPAGAAVHLRRRGRWLSQH